MHWSAPLASYGWAQVDTMLGDDVRPQLYVEPSPMAAVRPFAPA